MDSKFNHTDQAASESFDREKFMTIIGELMYMFKSRPDIHVSVQKLAARSIQPTLKDFQACLRVLFYLYHTRDLCLTLPSSKDLHNFIVWSDAALDAYTDSKSQLAFCAASDFESPPFYTESTKESTVSMSPTECEVGAAVGGAKLAINLRDRFEEAGFPQAGPTCLFVDNTSIIHLTSSMPCKHRRVQHYIRKINFLIDCIQKGIIYLSYVNSIEQLADILTKPLGPSLFIPHRDKLLGVHLLSEDFQDKKKKDESSEQLKEELG